ncbi:MAG: DUF427 domain-containing protein [Spirochaetota bacterium]
MRPKIIQPGPGQESVWDYPRPPRLEKAAETLQVYCEKTLIAETNQGFRMLETSHPPVYYFPPEDIEQQYFQTNDMAYSFCEFKGKAVYHDFILNGKTIAKVAWHYPQITGVYKGIENYWAFYPSKVESCWVGKEKVQAQEGDFYGGWITTKIVGPFKGGTGTWGW